jgi:hypothetical protein
MNAPRFSFGRIEKMREKLLTILLLLSVGNAALARGTYQEPDDFLRETFAGEPPEPAVIWLTGERREVTEGLLGHRYPTLRIRYWKRDARSAWILEEVGKEQPITVGLTVDQGRLERMKVLVFRESRGWEVRHPFFTDQFIGATLDDRQRLDRHIDGISGATLSVRAMKKLATLALYLDAELRAEDVAPAP